MLIPLKPIDKVLRTVCQPVTLKELKTTAFQAQVDELLDYVHGANNKGPARDRTRPSTVGLSANQVGVNRQISIVDLAIGQKRVHDIHVLINPEITWHSRAELIQSEGCVNLPEIWGPVPRWREVEVTALDRSGNRLTIRAKGWPARLLQHEIDHLHGRLFVDRLPDPSKAHKVVADQMVAYNKKVNRLSWPHYINVEHLITHEISS